MYIFITILIVFAAVLMIFAVLVQKSKGGGLASGFAASNQYMGVRKTTDFLEKFTWTLAATILVLSILTAKFTASRANGRQSEVEVEQPAPLNPVTAPTVTPEIPVPALPQTPPTE
jgi:preprotein translocase subunit SecG